MDWLGQEKIGPTHLYMPQHSIAPIFPSLREKCIVQNDVFCEEYT